MAKWPHRKRSTMPACASTLHPCAHSPAVKALPFATHRLRQRRRHCVYDLLRNSGRAGGVLPSNEVAIPAGVQKAQHSKASLSWKVVVKSIQKHA